MRNAWGGAKNGNHIHWRIQGERQRRPDSIVFIFMQFFGKIYQNIRFEAPPLRMAPTPGNPGSATDNKQSPYFFLKKYFADYGSSLN